MVEKELLDEVRTSLNPHIRRMLDLASFALDEKSYERFRTLFLNEFGQKGFEGEITEILSRWTRNGMGGNTFAGGEVSP